MNYRKPHHLYHQVIQDIKDKIATTKLPAGHRIETHKQLAENYNVSLITIKKAIDELVNEGILISKAGKGTFVADTNPQTQSVKNNETSNTIGFVLRDLKNPFFSLIAHEIEVLAHSKGYTTLIANSSDDQAKEEHLIRKLKNSGVTGIIIASMAQKYFANESVRSLHKEKFPYVMVSYTHDPDIYFVGSDHIYGGFLATEHLIKQGYQSIGYINSTVGNLISDLRRIGYFKALEHYNLPINPDNIFYLQSGGGWNYFTAGYEIGLSICKQKECPNAFFVYNDLAAIGFQRAVLELGLAIPDDIAIVGYDDIEFASLARVPLTTIRQNTREIAKKALEAIIDQLQEKKPRIQTLLEPKLIVRHSSVKSP